MNSKTNENTLGRGQKVWRKRIGKQENVAGVWCLQNPEGSQMVRVEVPVKLG